MGIDVHYKKYTKLHKSCPKIHTHKYITLIHTYHIHTATHIIRTETHIDNTCIHTEHADTQRYITYLNICGHTHHKCMQISHKVTKTHYPSVVTHYIYKYTQTEHIQRHTDTRITDTHISISLCNLYTTRGACLIQKIHDHSLFNLFILRSINCAPGIVLSASHILLLNPDNCPPRLILLPFPSFR